MALGTETGSQTITVTIDNDAHQAEAVFDDAAYPLVYRIWIAHDPENEDGVPWRIDDDSDADSPSFTTWDEAVRAFRRLVGEQIDLDGDAEFVS